MPLPLDSMVLLTFILLLLVLRMRLHGLPLCFLLFTRTTSLLMVLLMLDVLLFTHARFSAGGALVVCAHR
jgi:hypothetical protein